MSPQSLCLLPAIEHIVNAIIAFSPTSETYTVKLEQSAVQRWSCDSQTLRCIDTTAHTDLRQ